MENISNPTAGKPRLMALLIKSDSTTKPIQPKNGKDFSCEELNALIGCNLVQVVRLPDNYYMIIDESGALKKDRVKNEMATELYQMTLSPESESKTKLKELEAMGAVIHYLPGNEENFIYGNAVLCKKNQFI